MPANSVIGGAECVKLILLDADDVEYAEGRRFILLIINNICVNLRSSALSASHEYRYLTHSRYRPNNPPPNSTHIIPHLVYASVLVRCMSHIFLKYPGEMLGIFESQFVSDFADGFVCA